ncbi:MAG: class I SAM-dependent methyltransferase [Methanomicrobiaceae archaeon]|nr:class I SAM-dependent methyltransferase [Methanomicrobiaceae archaeon]
MEFFCNLCNKETAFEYIQDYPNQHRVFENLKLYRCGECGVVFALPYPTEKDLDYYYEEVWDTSDDVNIVYEIQAFERVKYIHKFTGDKDNLKVLDIGSGHGLLYDAFLKKFGNVEFHATELNPENQKRLQNKGIKVSKSIDEYSNDKFDIVCLCSVLEHLTEPYKFLSGALELLNENGYLFLELPDRDYIFKPVLDPHVGFYSEECLRYLGKRLNIDTIDICTYGRDHESLKKEFMMPNRLNLLKFAFINRFKKAFFKFRYHNSADWEKEYYYDYLKIHEEGGSRWWIRGIFKK